MKSNVAKFTAICLLVTVAILMGYRGIASEVISTVSITGTSTYQTAAKTTSINGTTTTTTGNQTYKFANVQVLQAVLGSNATTGYSLINVYDFGNGTDTLYATTGTGTNATVRVAVPASILSLSILDTDIVAAGKTVEDSDNEILSETATGTVYATGNMGISMNGTASLGGLLTYASALKSGAIVVGGNRTSYQYTAETLSGVIAGVGNGNFTGNGTATDPLHPRAAVSLTLKITPTKYNP